MKIFRIIILLVFLTILANCGNRNYASNVQFITSDDSSITVNTGTKNAEYTAIYQLLFRGIPGSNQTLPIISTSEDEVWRRNPAYFEEFFNNKRYSTFIVSSFKNDQYSNTVTVNLKALKADLEHHSIIRKFGY